MNARAETVTLQLGEAQVIIPGQAAAMAYLEKILDESRPIPLAASAGRRPAVGSPWKDGEYAGLTIFENEPFDLVVVSTDFDRGGHEAALKWAAQQKAMLPSRFDNLVLFTNMKDRFKTDYYYWCAELPAGNPGYAWCQGFAGGYQGWLNRSIQCRAVAVRRYPIQ
jgi:hypothetical protein